MSVDVILGLGASLGDAEGSLRLAVQALDATAGLSVRAVSRLYLTAPEGGVARRPFLNAAVGLRCALDAEALRAICAALETKLGRRPTARWADRALDIDLLLFGQEIILTDALTVPHIRLHTRQFALVPAAEIAPTLRHPGLGRALGALPLPRGARPSPVGALTAPADGVACRWPWR